MWLSDIFKKHQSIYEGSINTELIALNKSLEQGRTANQINLIVTVLLFISTAISVWLSVLSVQKDKVLEELKLKQILQDDQIKGLKIQVDPVLIYNKQLILQLKRMEMSDTIQISK